VRPINLFAAWLSSFLYLTTLIWQPVPALCQTADDERLIQWQLQHLVEPCAGDCGVAVFGGSEVTSDMSKILVRQPRFPTAWQWGDGHIIGAAVSRPIAAIGQVARLEPELGVAQRFQSMHATEAWVALYLRWLQFPWNDYIRTTAAISTGIDVASEVEFRERLEDTHRRGSNVLHYFSPEITFALPQRSDIQLLLQFHHRSGIHLIRGVSGGAQFGVMGLRK